MWAHLQTWLEIESQAVTTFPFQIQGLTERGAAPMGFVPWKGGKLLPYTGTVKFSAASSVLK